MVWHSLCYMLSTLSSFKSHSSRLTFSLSLTPNIVLLLLFFVQEARRKGEWDCWRTSGLNAGCDTAKSKGETFLCPVMALSVVSLYLTSFLCFWLTTVELSEFFLWGAVANMWLWHWIRGCRVTSPLPDCHTDEYQKSDALDMFVVVVDCFYIALFSALE